MTKFISLVAITMLLANIATAQLEKSNFRFGLHFSPNMTWVRPETRLLNAEAAGYGFGYGLMIERKIGTNYFLSTGFGVSQLRYSSSVDSTVYKLPNGNSDIFYNPTYEYKVQYFDVPLTVKMRTNQIGALRIYGQFGLSAGFLFQSQARVNNLPLVFDPEEYFFVNRIEDYRTTFAGLETVNDRVTFFRTGILFGAGIEYLLSGETHLIVGFQLNNPLTDAYRGDALIGKTPSMALNLGIFF